MTHLDKLKFELKRVSKRKADLEREISELEFERDKEFIESKGFSFDKTYRVDYNYVNWYSKYYGFINPIIVNYDYRIDNLGDSEGVRLSEVNDNSHVFIYVPFEFLIEVNENE